jgi:hypothetical protein
MKVTSKIAIIIIATVCLLSTVVYGKSQSLKEGFPNQVQEMTKKEKKMDPLIKKIKHNLEVIFMHACQLNKTLYEIHRDFSSLIVVSREKGADHSQHFCRGEFHYKTSEGKKISGSFQQNGESPIPDEFNGDQLIKETKDLISKLESIEKDYEQTVLQKSLKKMVLPFEIKYHAQGTGKKYVRKEKYIKTKNVTECYWPFIKDEEHEKYYPADKGWTFIENTWKVLEDSPNFLQAGPDFSLDETKTQLRFWVKVRCNKGMRGWWNGKFKVIQQKKIEYLITPKNGDFVFNSFNEEYEIIRFDLPENNINFEPVVDINYKDKDNSLKTLKFPNKNKIEFNDSHYKAIFWYDSKENIFYGKILSFVSD